MTPRYRVKQISLTKDGDALDPPVYQLYDCWEEKLIGHRFKFEEFALAAMDRKNNTA